MKFEWNQFWGTGVVVIGIVVTFFKKVPLGIKLRSFCTEGKWTVLLGIVTIIVGLFVALEPIKQLEIDSCLDSGGCYDYDNNQCVNSKSEQTEHINKTMK